MFKNIIYGLSVLVAGAAAYFSFEVKKDLEAEIALFADAQNRKKTVEESEDTTKGTLKETKATLGEAEKLNAELISDMELMKSKEGLFNKSKEKAQVKIDEAEARLADFAKVKAEIDEQLKGVNVAWAQIPAEIKRQQEVRKKRGDDLDLLNEHIAKLTKDVADKRASNTRESDRLSKIRTKIARNAKVGAITSVNSTWGFVIVNLGTNNSNVTPQSKLLVTRNGRLLGRLTPNSVEASQTVCDLNARDINPGVRIQPGDQVTLADSSSGQ